MTKVSKEFKEQRKNSNMLAPIEFKGEIYYPVHFHYGYYVGMNGKVYSTIINNIRKVNDNGQGYMTVTMVRNDGYKYAKKVHQIIASTFYFHNQENLVPNHKNFDRSDNRVDNIELTTQEENYRHMYNSFIDGERDYNFRFDKETVLKIFYEKGTLTEVAKKFNIDKAIVHAIKTKKSYKSITKDLECDYVPNQKFRDIRLKYFNIWFYDYLQTDLTLKEAAEKNNVNKASMGTTWRVMGLPTKNRGKVFKMKL